MQSDLRLLGAIFPPSWFGRFVGKYTPNTCYTLQEASIPHARVRPPRAVDVIHSFGSLAWKVLDNLLFHVCPISTRMPAISISTTFPSAAWGVMITSDPATTPFCHCHLGTVNTCAHSRYTQETKAGQCTDYPSYSRIIVDTLTIFCYTYEPGMKQLWRYAHNTFIWMRKQTFGKDAWNWGGIPNPLGWNDLFSYHTGLIIIGFIHSFKLLLWYTNTDNFQMGTVSVV